MKQPKTLLNAGILIIFVLTQAFVITSLIEVISLIKIYQISIWLPIGLVSIWIIYTFFRAIPGIVRLYRYPFSIKSSKIRFIVTLIGGLILLGASFSRYRVCDNTVFCISPYIYAGVGLMISITSLIMLIVAVRYSPDS